MTIIVRQFEEYGINIQIICSAEDFYSLYIADLRIYGFVTR